MGLETGTWITDLVATNPPTSDKKNQGDDHLRLIKTVLRNSFPDSSRALYLTKPLNKITHYSAVLADDNSLITCNTAAGAIIITLPVGGITAGYELRIAKTSLDGNVVYVQPASGTISTEVGAFALLKISIPMEEQRFMFVAGSWLRVQTYGAPPSGTILMHTTSGVPTGYALAAGQDLLQGDNPELFARWGTGYGSGGAGLFRCPDLRDRFIVGSGSSYPVSGIGGANNIALATSEIPAHNHPVGISDTRTWITANNFVGSGGGARQATAAGSSWADGHQSLVTVNGGSITGSSSNTGGGAAHENRPPYYALSFIFGLR